MSKHTPGPWHVNHAGSAKKGEPFKIDEFYVYAPNTQDDTAICADVIDPVTQEPNEANARLIAAAPELLEALVMAREALASFCTAFKVPAFSTSEKFKKIDAAIAKATGAE